MKTCVFCMSKNEENIQDWINHYFSIGFDHIFLVDNNEYDKRYKIDDERVTVIWYPDEFHMFENTKFNYWRQSLLTKLGLIMAYDQDYDYCFICDDDEYLDLKGNYANVTDFLEKHNEYDSISITWEMVGDNGYLYISDEPKNVPLREIYKTSIWMHFECKSFYKFPKDVNVFKSDMNDYDLPHIMHYVTERNRLHIQEHVIEDNEVTVKHYPTFCLERFLRKKSTFKGYNPFITNKYLRYYLLYNPISDKILNAYVDLCKKYNIEISKDDKEILEENNIHID